MEQQANTTALPIGPLNELFSALAKSQSQMHAALKSSDNPFFKSKYADFGGIVEASRPALTSNGLAVVQRIVVLPDGTEALHSILGHSSGQYIDSTMRIKPTKNDVQSLGSYITYLKRYAYAALVGVITEDDDGEKSMPRGDNSPGSNTSHDSDTGNIITPALYERLNEALAGLSNAPWLRARILEHNKIAALNDLPTAKFQTVLRFIVDNGKD